MTGARRSRTGAGNGFPADMRAAVCRRLRANKPVRRTLPEWGRVHIDRQIPLLCVYRRPTTGRVGGTEKLVTSEASYLICSGRRRLHKGLAELVRGIAAVLIEQFGACLLLELWDAPAGATGGSAPTTEPTPAFRLLSTRGASRHDVTADLESALARVKLGRRKARVSSASAAKSCPGTMRPFLSASEAAEMGCLLYGIEVEPIFRSEETGEVFPHVLRMLRHRLTIALRRVFFDFARKHTTHRPAHYHALGRRAVVKAVWEVDRMLADASDQFDLLLQITPVNTEQAWRAFKRSKGQRAPVFLYRPLPVETLVLKRKLYKAPVERVEDPALASLFREKIDEVDRQVTMLQDLNTTRFLHESVQLFGAVDDDLFELATSILAKIPPRCRERAPRVHLDAERMALRARREIEYLRQQDAALHATVQVCPDVAGLLVSRGNLLISTHVRVPESRVNALLQHEIGTHVLTFHNGRSQPFRQLHTGLAGYECLQEGVAVLSEYLVGGLSRPRLRLLAARVVAVRFLLDGASFIETHRHLKDRYGLADRTAFMVAMRVHRGGGLTKDAVYLRGLREVLDYVGRGGALEHLLVGKIALKDIPIVRELMWRGVLKEPVLLPRYLGQPETMQKLMALRDGMSIMDLIDRR